ncbi:hypothetical protein NA57DRAFT_73937 [Rhizodiscina lignyota]|uniref:Glycosyltransferase family 2 protein n=1 Tax=Rhizodiscina lignyota TaxID=1504668 RepID=A0A9P4IEH8_9PEZI|nr:hypothetical protein NA57DRAFT_73937 [Rhizodiscina lignyota]
MEQWWVEFVTDARYDWKFFVFLLACFLFCSRQLRLLVNLRAVSKHRPIPIPDHPTFTPQDVTVIIPTICNVVHELEATIRSVVRNDPHEIYIVTTDEKLKLVRKLATSISKRIKVLRSPVQNKRIQMCRAVPKVTTKFILFADDDVSLPDRTVLWMLAPFESGKMGGVGTAQRVRRDGTWNFWKFLGFQYIARRNFDCSAGVYMDGGLPCLSGRAAMYRTPIIQDHEFMHNFTHEFWEWPWPFNRYITYLIHADDDNFLTRWMVDRGWDIYIQVHEQCMVETTLEEGWKFVKQCLRWSRSNWRSNYTSLFRDRTIWRRHPWSVFAFFLTTFTEFALPRDAFLCWGVAYGTENLNSPAKWAVRALLWLHILLICRIVKFNIFRYPSDLLYLPLIPIFGWIHSVTIKIWALSTLNETSWGSREGADADDAFRMIALPPYDGIAGSSSNSQHDPLYDLWHDDENDEIDEIELNWEEVALPQYNETIVDIV